MSTADWDAELWTNKQHLMSRLGKQGHRVLYVDSLGLRSPGPSAADARRIRARLLAWRPLAKAVAPNVWRDSPLVMPSQARVWRSINAWLLRARTARNVRRLGLIKPVLWTYTPAAVEIFSNARFRALVYHCVDDLAAYPGVDADRFRAQERRLVETADVCIASSRPLLAHLQGLGANNVHYWPNPADTSAYARARRERQVAPETPTLGFIGAVQEHKVDFELLRHIASARPDWSLRLIGPVGAGLRRSSVHAGDFPPNIDFRGPETLENLPAEVAQFDVGLIPYQLNAYTEKVFPMKVFEYLAAGVPVVATRLPSILGEVDHVGFATGDRDFVAAIEAALAPEPQSPRAREVRAQYALQYSWEARTDEAARLLAAF